MPVIAKNQYRCAPDMQGGPENEIIYSPAAS